MMKKLLEKWWFLGAGVVLLGIYVYGSRQMFFHQDDLDWFILANRSFVGVMRYPIADHINYLFRLLLVSEWRLFGFSYPPYLLISILLHVGVVVMIYLLARETTGRRDLPAAAALLFAINTNWNEVILWTSGQTISITVLFVLIAMHFVWRGRRQVLLIALSCLTSALALGLPIAALLTYGITRTPRRINRLGWGIVATLVLVGLIYHFFGGDGTHVGVSWQWIVQVAVVWVLAITHTVVGRLLIPFDRFETIRIIVALLLMGWGGWVWRKQLMVVWSDSWSRFLILQLGFYYLIVAAGRAQYGIGIMRAERYGYLGLALALLLLVRVLRKWKLGRWVWLVPVIVLIQCAGFYTRAQAYIVRPQQLKALVVQLRQTDNTLIDQSAYLPGFVLNDARLRYSDLLPLLNH